MFLPYRRIFIVGLECLRIQRITFPEIRILVHDSVAGMCLEPPGVC